MHLRNRHGTPVDPVPFLVVSLSAAVVAYSYGPLYLMALGVGLPAALLACSVLTVAATVGAFHRYVWATRPSLRAEVPAADRLRRLVYGSLIGVALLALLALPLFVR